MSNNNEYDPIGELFRQKLENHQIPVDNSSWNEIEHRLKNQRNTTAIWLWGSGMAAAATIAVLLFVGKPAIDEIHEPIVSQYIERQESVPTANIIETFPAEAEQETTTIAQIAVVLPAADVEKYITDEIIAIPYEIQEANEAVNQPAMLLSFEFNDSAAHLLNNSITENVSIVSRLDVSSVENQAEENNKTVRKKGKWLFTASFGTGYTVINEPGSASLDMSSSTSVFLGNNNYASSMSGNIRSLKSMDKDNFSNINHSPPLSVSIRLNSCKNGGLQTGLVYSYLSSFFEWSDWSSNSVRQRLHYIGIPVNLVGYLGNNLKSGWRFYLSGGVMVEKGLRAVYRQETQDWNSIRTTTVRSSIDGFHCSLNFAPGVSYQLEKGFGVYFEPRIGYYFKSKQPISIRTEAPLYFGINLGIHFEL